MINIQIFHSNLLKIDKKPYQDFDIYYIGYITIKKIGNCKNIHSVNPLYLITGLATGYFTEKNGEKYLILDAIDKYEEFFLGIKSEVETINGGEKTFYEKHYAKAWVNTDDNIPLNKKIKCPQVYLDEILY